MTTKGHATAKVNGTVVAEATEWEVVQNTIYFPPDTIKKEYFVNSSLHTTCQWRGEASYYTIKVDGTELKDAAWYYPSPQPTAANITGYVAFYKDKVDIETE